MKNIDLSIIIVNYRSWAYLKDCLSSFERFPPNVSYEIIVIDNDSKDNKFEEFSAEHLDITLVKNTGNYGFSHGCNTGAKLAVGDYLLFLNPDTELTKDNAIDAMFEYLNQHADVGIVSCRNITPNGHGEEVRYLSPWLLFGYVRMFYRLIHKDSLAIRYSDKSGISFPDWITGSVVLISTPLFKQIGGWNDQRYWMYYEDPDICYKVKKQNKKIALLRHVTIQHAEGGASEANIESIIRSKTEKTISAHNYIQEVSSGGSRLLLHILFFLKNQVNLIGIIFNIPLFWKKKFKVKTGVFINTWKYYLQAIYRRTWKNPRLMHTLTTPFSLENL